MTDIGGASTELVLFKDYKPVELVSLPIRCLNLSDRFVREIIPGASERKLIRTEIPAQLDKICNNYQQAVKRTTTRYLPHTIQNTP